MLNMCYMTLVKNVLAKMSSQRVKFTKNINDYPKSRDAMHEANFKQVHPILVNE